MADRMDRPLESSRDSSHPYGGGGGGGGGRYGGGGYHHRGRGRGRGGRGGYRGGYRGGRGRRGGRGGGRHHHHRNRQNDHYEDPNTRLMKQLSVMISRVGEFKAPLPSDDNNSNPINKETRPVVAAVAKNISDLTKVVSKASNLPTFLKFIPPPPPPKEDSVPGMGFQRPPPKPEDQAGPMAHLIVSCAATLPLQTPSYAALTLSVHAYAGQAHADYAGFASRCVTYTMQRLSYDMDALFLESSKSIADRRPKVACRIKLLLRYLALLGRLNVVQAQEQEASEQDSAAMSCTLLGLLNRFVEAAVAAAPTDDAFGTTTAANAGSSLILVYFVLSTIPYLLSYISRDVIQDQLLDPLQALMGAYSSTFSPGVGMTAILLKDEQVEATDEEEEEDDDDDDDEEAASEVVSDSLQDLYRSVQMLMKEEDTSNKPASRFALLTDEPWQEISGPPPPSTEAESAPIEDVDMDAEAKVKHDPGVPPPESGPLVNPDAPLRLPLPEGGFQSLRLLTNPEATNTFEDDNANATPSLKVQSFPLEAVVFGRLPIFGAPKSTDDEAEQDEEDMDEDDAPANEQVAAYGKEFGVLDRFFLADAIRDLLCCHQSIVSTIGQERGSAKNVAEQLWSVGQVFRGDHGSSESAAPVGLEYGILEVVLALILQSSSNSTFRQIFVSRVLLELTRLQPTQVSPALALAVSNMFQYYIPALVPTARRNLSCWLSFHLVNTDYQWPSSFWTHWQTFTLSSAKPIQSRGSFVKTTLHFMMENVHNPGLLVKECLPAECQELANQVVVPVPDDNSADGSAIESVEKDIARRIWDNDEHPDSLNAYIVGDELSESLALSSVLLDSASDMKTVWCRSGLVLRCLLRPLEREHQRMRSAVEQAQSAVLSSANGDNEGDMAMEEDEDMSEDALAVLQEVVVRYGPVLISAIRKDKEIVEANFQGSEQTNMLESCEPCLLNILSEKAAFSRSILTGALDCLLQQKDIVTGMGILRWVLDDTGGSQQRPPKMVERWNEIAIDAIRHELSKKIAEAKGTDSAREGGMVIDRTGDESNDAGAEASQSNSAEAQLLATMECVSPLLDYIVRRACTLLVDLVDESITGNKLKPEQVELVEGVKICVRTTHGLFYSELRKSIENDTGMSERDIKDCLSQSTMTGWKLSSTCQEFTGGHAVNVLRDSLATI